MAAESEGAHQEQAAQVAAARERFTLLARGPEDRIDLAEAVLLIAAEEYPGLDVAGYLARLDGLGARVRQRLDLLLQTEQRDSDESAIAALRHVLFEEEGYTGDPIEQEYNPYYHPRNSFLNQVIDTRRGMPITLAVLYCEVARRAGLDAVGVALPGHFMAEFRGRHLSALVDPYNRGNRLREEDRQRIPQEFLTAAAKKQILVRILTNLKQAYRQRGPLPKALAAIERILVLHPTIDQVRDRGMILSQMNLPGPAWFDLKLYARLAQGVPDAEAAGEAADRLWKDMGRLN